MQCNVTGLVQNAQCLPNKHSNELVLTLGSCLVPTVMGLLSPKENKNFLNVAIPQLIDNSSQKIPFQSDISSLNPTLVCVRRPAR